MRRKQTYDLLLPIFESIPRTFKASSIVDNGDGTYTLNSCNTLWLHPDNLRVLTINGNDYSIVDMLPNEWVKLKGSVTPLSEFDIYPPFPYHGTVLAQNALLKTKLESTDKLPMIWLHEITPETFNNDPGDLMERESECDIYFLTCANPSDWITIDHDQKAIIPMRNLMDAFLTLLENQPGKVNPEFRHQVFDHADFGRYLKEKGHVGKVFDDNLSGVQLRITIQFYKDLSCTSC